MTEISQLKFIQWRPIGVCDSGEGNKRKAKIFSKVDLESITSPNIKRDNWRENTKVMKIITIYANDVAKISTLTNGMKNPEISEIKLVGAVLGIDQTPRLNQESIDGKVQFFQISFKEGKVKKKSSNWFKVFFRSIAVVFGIILTMISVYIFLNYFSDLSLRKNNKYVLKCGYNRGAENYLDELKSLRESLLIELSRFPEWITFKKARAKCRSNSIGINNQEKILLDCFISARNRIKNIKFSNLPNLKKIELCAGSLCQRDLSHLASMCRRL